MTGAAVAVFACKFALIPTHFGTPSARSAARRGERAIRWTRNAPSSPAVPRPSPRCEAPTRRILGGTDTGADGPRELVLGRYRLHERLGAGGFGVVWRASDELLQREVAVKRIPLRAGGDGERATREALACARLSHPAIVALYEACVRDGDMYLISELVEGRTLAGLIADGYLPDRRLLEIGIALCRGPRPRPRPRRDPPRHQAPERARPRPPRAAPAGGQADRLRRRQPGGRGHPDPHRRRPRDARLHGSRAVRGQARGRAGGPLLAGPGPVRGAVRDQPGPRRQPGRDRAPDRAPGGAAAHRPAGSPGLAGLGDRHAPWPRLPRPGAGSRTSAAHSRAPPARDGGARPSPSRSRGGRPRTVGRSPCRGAAAPGGSCRTRPARRTRSRPRPCPPPPPVRDFPAGSRWPG